MHLKKVILFTGTYSGLLTLFNVPSLKVGKAGRKVVDWQLDY